MENGTKIILSTSINVQPNPCIKRSIVCKYAAEFVYMIIGIMYK